MSTINTNSRKVLSQLLCGRPISRITGIARPSVRASVPTSVFYV